MTVNAATIAGDGLKRALGLASALAAVGECTTSIHVYMYSTMMIWKERNASAWYKEAVTKRSRGAV